MTPVRTEGSEKHLALYTIYDIAYLCTVYGNELVINCVIQHDVTKMLLYQKPQSLIGELFISKPGLVV